MIAIGRSSLKGQLVRRFALVLGLFMFTLNAAFFVLLLFVLPASNVADRNVIPVIEKAIRVENGHLVLVQTPELRAISETSPAFWFAVANSNGDNLDYGPIPEEVSGIVKRLPNLQAFEIREEDQSPFTATLVKIATEVGSLNMIYGGRSQPGNYILNLLWGLKVIYLPLILLPLLVVLLALPILVGRSLSGLKKTIHRASSIEVNSLGERLPKDGVVDELHPLVDAMNAALIRIDDDVTQRQRFFANAAHELRTPIAILQTRLEALPVSAQKERLLLDVSRLAATAEQLLAMQRFTGIQSRTHVDMVALCEDVAADCAPLAIATGYDPVFETHLPSFTILGDKTSLESAVTNLIRNAIDHGGGNGRIGIEIRRDGSIDVYDDGPGIPETERKKIFEPFYRIVPKSTGAGLGLALVAQVATAHGGTISVVPQQNGARFRLSLPSAPKGDFIQK